MIIVRQNKLTDDIIENNNNNNNKYILLVDDDKDTIFTFDLYLKSIGYTIFSFVNPVEALEFFNKNFADCSLVITDYGMPQMSGIDLMNKIREKDEYYTKKIILISATIKGDILTDYYEELSNLRVNKIIEKPMSLEILKIKLEH
jgi:response regulator RpfG family c-di-GMP phosphodiesterase